MLFRFVTRLQGEAVSNLTSNSAPLFQGALMQKIDSEYGVVLHQEGWKPYSQYLEKSKGDIFWHFHTLSEEAEQKLVFEPCLSSWTELYLERKNITVKFSECEQRRETEDELMARTFFSVCPRIVKLQFVTPTAFKSNGKYQNYPTPHFIFQSLIGKYDTVSTNVKIYTQDVLEHLSEYSVVIGYNLRSTIYHIENIKIPSFVGTLTLKFTGPQQLVNLAHLLLQFGSYSGVGIKTTMGMGGFRIVERQEKNAAKTI